MKTNTIFSRLRAWIKNIPIQDPVDRQLGGLLQVILLGLITILIFATIANLFLVPVESVSQLEIIIRGSIVTAIFGLPLFLLRRGFFRSATIFLIGIFLFLITYSVLSTNLHSIADSLSLFTLVIVLAGLLVGQKALVISIIYCIGIVLFSALREQNPALRLDSIAIAGNFILINGLMSVFINFFGSTLRNTLHSSLQREKDLKKEIENRKLVSGAKGAPLHINN